MSFKAILSRAGHLLAPASAASAGLSTLTGVIVGALFSALGLPIPAPLVIEGILGVAGLWLGYVIVQAIKGS